MIKSNILLIVFLMAGWAFCAPGSEEAIKHITFEATRIEGQRGAIKALIVTSDKRPQFGPMALELAQRSIKFDNVNKKSLEGRLFQGIIKIELPK